MCVIGVGAELFSGSPGAGLDIPGLGSSDGDRNWAVFSGHQLSREQSLSVTLFVSTTSCHGNFAML